MRDREIDIDMGRGRYPKIVGTDLLQPDLRSGVHHIITYAGFYLLKVSPVHAHGEGN